MSTEEERDRDYVKLVRKIEEKCEGRSHKTPLVANAKR